MNASDKEKLKIMILEHIRREAVNKDIKMHTKIETIDIDSIDVINVVFSIEEELHIRIGPEIEIKETDTISELIDRLIEKIEPVLKYRESK